MPHGFGLVNHSPVSLIVFLSVRAPDIKKKLRQIEISFIAGCPVQLDKSHFNDLMPGIDFLPVVSEVPVNQVGRFYSDIEEGSLAGCLVMSNRGFVKVTQVIEFMTQYGIKFPPVGTGPFMKSLSPMHFCYGTVSEQVAVILLCQTYLPDQSIEIGIKFRIGFCLKRKGRSFDDLENIGIIKGINGPESTGVEPARYLKVLNPAR